MNYAHAAYLQVDPCLIYTHINTPVHGQDSPPFHVFVGFSTPALPPFQPNKHP